MSIQRTSPPVRSFEKWPVHARVLLAAGAIGCSTSTVPAQRSAPVQPAFAVDSAPHSRASINLSGAWATGRDGEPTQRRATLHMECNVSPALWTLQQTGDSVSAIAFATFHAQGVPSSPVSTHVATGHVSGLDVIMNGAGGKFVLRYDTASGHLRGTLDRMPFWAIPLDVVRPENCIAIP